MNEKPSLDQRISGVVKERAPLGYSRLALVSAEDPGLVRIGMQAIAQVRANLLRCGLTNLQADRAALTAAGVPLYQIGQQDQVGARAVRDTLRRALEKLGQAS